MSSEVAPHLREDYYTPVGAYPVLLEVQHERNRQDELWGEQNHPILWPSEHESDDREYYAEQAEAWKIANRLRVAELNAQGAPKDRNCSWDGVLLEEVYEALAETDPARIRAELVQAAAVIVAMIESIDRNTSA